ncbi:MAG: hypothetical protein ACLTER_20235 [Ruminococcus sp.]
MINYITCQDGFTLNDLVSYNYKHNEANGEGNNDGCSYNYSWNCGIEGPRPEAVDPSDEGAPDACCFCRMLFSQGVPMIYGGDEIGNSREGNNECATAGTIPLAGLTGGDCERNASMSLPL